MMGFFKHLGSLFKTAVSRLGLFCFRVLLTGLTFFSSGQAARAHPAPQTPEEVPPSAEGRTILDPESSRPPVVPTGTAADLERYGTEPAPAVPAVVSQSPLQVAFGINRRGDSYASWQTPEELTLEDGRVVPHPLQSTGHITSLHENYITENRCEPQSVPSDAFFFFRYQTNKDACRKTSPDEGARAVISHDRVADVGWVALVASYRQKQAAEMGLMAITPPPKSQQWQGNIADAAAAVQQLSAAAANDAPTTTAAAVTPPASPAQVEDESTEITAAQPVEQPEEEVSSTVATPDIIPQDQAAAEELPTTPTLTLEPVPVVTLEPLNAAAFLPSDDLEAEAEAAEAEEVVFLEVQDAPADLLESVFVNPAQTASAAEPAASAESTTVAVSDYALCTTDAQRADLLMSMYGDCAQR
jgi:hypothetical protein